VDFLRDPTRDLYLSNVPYHLDEEAIFRLCSRHGVVLRVKLVTDTGGQSRGRAYVRAQEWPSRSNLGRNGSQGIDRIGLT